MPSRSPAAPRVPEPARRRTAVVVALVVALTGGACSAAATVTGRGPAGTVAPPTVAAPGEDRGVDPDGGTLVRRGEFVAVCPFSHRSPDDPLVHAHHDGATVATAHSHDFFGNTTTDEHSTTAALLASGATTCDLAEDLSSYWAPTMFRAGVPVAADQFTAYYDAAPGADPASVLPMPAGLSMIAGNDPRPDAVRAAGWACGKVRDDLVAAPSCRFRAPLTLRLTFPDCWNGRDVDSADHRSHMAYRVDGACPASHPVPIVRLVLSIRYPVYGDPSDLVLASGALATAHADFMNAWTEAGMRDFTDLCIHRQVTCGTA